MVSKILALKFHTCSASLSVHDDFGCVACTGNYTFALTLRPVYRSAQGSSVTNVAISEEVMYNVVHCEPWKVNAEPCQNPFQNRTNYIHVFSANIIGKRLTEIQMCCERSSKIDR